jgi:hypothetical protein
MSAAAGKITLSLDLTTSSSMTREGGKNLGLFNATDLQYHNIDRMNEHDFNSLNFWHLDYLDQWPMTN